MALALKKELHRLVDEIPDSRPELVQVMLGIGLLLQTHDLGKADPEFQRLVRDVADLHARTSDPGELAAGWEALRNRWMRGESASEYPLPRVLAEAPDDDEPLTPEEREMLDARLRAAKTTPTIPHDEVVRRLRS